MAEIKLNWPVLLRHDTAANWAAKNPVLREGEVGIETDTRYLKIGDGSTAWNSLKYLAMAYANVTGTPTLAKVATSGNYNDLTNKPTSIANANVAAKLAAAKSVQTNLASTAAASFDGSANITPGVTGTLPVGNGGTGQTSLDKVTVGAAKSVPWAGVTGKPSIPSKTSALENDSGYSYLIKNVIDLTDTTKYAADTYWPCVAGIPYTGDRRLMLSVQLNSGSKPSWSTHSAGFTCVIDVIARAGGWGTTDAGSTILNHHYSWSNVDPCSYVQFTKSSNACFYLRGGGKYFIYTDFSASWHVITTETNLLGSSTYTEMVAPTKTLPAISINRAMIMCNVDGLASKATADASGNNIASTYATKDYVAQAIKEALAATIITYDGKVTYKG